MILITGGAGFIGSMLCRELNDSSSSEQIILCDHLGSKHLKWKNLLGQKFKDYISADELLKAIRERSALCAQIRKIYHLGACTDTTEARVDYLMQNNYRFSQEIFKFACEYKLKLVYASSAATYGNGDLGYGDDHQLIAKLRPLNPYGFFKQLFDQWVLGEKTTPPHWVGVKFFNVYGPYEAHKGEMSSVVYKAYVQIKGGGPVKLFKSHRDDYSDGAQLRDFIYVKDVVKALQLMMDGDGDGDGDGELCPSAIYNLGTGVARSFNDLVKAVFNSLSLAPSIAPSIKYIDMPMEVRSQYQYRTEAKMGKFSRCFPDFKFTTLEEGVDDYLLNHLEKEKI